MGCWMCGGEAEEPEAVVCAACEGYFKQHAFRAFIKAGGSRAHFERWWPDVWRTSMRGHVARELSRILSERTRRHYH